MEQDTWFLLLVGLIGMLQNVLVAGLKRSSAAHGLPLKMDERIKETNVGEENEAAYVDEDHVIPALERADKLSSGVGKALVPLFFPVGLRPNQEWWNKGEATPRSVVTDHGNTIQQGQSDSVVSPSSRATKSAEAPGGIRTANESHATISRSPE